MIRKGQGLIIHTHDCPAVAKLRTERGNWVDVEWEPADGRLFEASLRVMAHNQPGVLARLAAGIAETQSNIVNIRMDEDRTATTSVYFTLQVADRTHLARIVRALRRVPEVVRITRYAEPSH
jgi:guanosine-3',5'-bis(diphosphate) 3'-pyrophosphohydrolase